MSAQPGVASPESQKYWKERKTREYLAFMQGPATRMEVENAMQQLSQGVTTANLGLELFAQYLASKGLVNLDDFRSFCAEKMKPSPAAESGPAEPASLNAGQEAPASGIILTDGETDATDSQGTENSV